jgi:hypothetical protein
MSGGEQAALGESGFTIPVEVRLTPYHQSANANRQNKKAIEIALNGLLI